MGEVDSFIHIFEYEGMPGFESVKNKIKESKGHSEFFNMEILPLIQSRTSQVSGSERVGAGRGSVGCGGSELRWQD